MNERVDNLSRIVLPDGSPSHLRLSIPDEGDPCYDPPEVREQIAELERHRYEPGDVSPEPTPIARPSRFRFVGSADFANGDYKPHWLISRILTASEPGVIAGPSKALKTNISVELAVSLAAGCPFLGKFEVPKQTRVAIVSGESGQHTLQETANRVCRSKELTLDVLDGYLDWCFDLPTFSDLASMGEFADELAKLNAEVVIIDPVYLALGAIDAKNLFEAGAAFRVVAEVLLKAGCTPLLVHHANRQLTIGEPMELQNLAYSGLEQFARQFILLNRRERYRGDGTHDLWCTVGGSAGHGGLWSLHIEEGVVDENFAGREWKVTVQTRAEVQEDRVEQKDRLQREQALRKLMEEEREFLAALDAEIAGGQPAVTRNAIQERCPRFSASKIQTIAKRLLERDQIEEIDFTKDGAKKSKRSVSGFRRVG